MKRTMRKIIKWFWLLIPIAVTVGALVASRTITGGGTVTPSFGLSVDKTSIDWGSLSRGQIVTDTVTVINTGELAMSLSMSTNILPTYLQLTWDQENTVLQAGQSVVATFTLTVAIDAPFESFSFEIVVTGTETS